MLVATANCCCHRRGKAIAAAPGRRCRGGGLDNRDLTGLSHGASGVALALFELAAATGELRFREAAERGFEYEQQYFSSRHNNWPDFRELMLNTPEAQWNYSLTWCHGAPGIALARLRAWQLTGRAEYREQAEAGLRTTAASVGGAMPGMGTWCLCHGTPGNADVLLIGAEILGDAPLMCWRSRQQSAVSRRTRKRTCRGRPASTAASRTRA